MSVRLEGVVRPFQEGEVFTARRTVTIEKTPAIETPVLEWGKAIPANYLRPDTVLEVKDVTENSRVTETVRITNPEDPNQYVDVERIKSMVMRNNSSGKEESWTFNN